MSKTDEQRNGFPASYVYVYVFFTDDFFYYMKRDDFFYYMKLALHEAGKTVKAVKTHMTPLGSLCFLSMKRHEQHPDNNVWNKTR